VLSRRPHPDDAGDPEGQAALVFIWCHKQKKGQGEQQGGSAAQDYAYQVARPALS